MVAQLIWVALENMFWIFRQTLREAILYSRFRWWYKVRFSLMLSWLGSSPNLAVLRFLRKNSPQMLQGGGLPDDCGGLTYGETLPGTAYRLLKLASASAQTKVADLGCGRGIVPLTAASAFQAPSIGLDIIEEYIHRGRKAAHLLNLTDQVDFQELNFCHDKIPSADIYFLTGLCLEDKTWRKLQKQLAAQAPEEAVVISVSRLLRGPEWELQSRQTEAFTWGTAEVYLYTKKHVSKI
ncbi:MAG: methyltransferase [Candidatus Bruticola sp.]